MQDCDDVIFLSVKVKAVSVAVNFMLKMHVFVININLLQNNFKLLTNMNNNNFKNTLLKFM